VLVSPVAGGLNFDGGLMDTATAAQLSFSNPLYNFRIRSVGPTGNMPSSLAPISVFPKSRGELSSPIPVVAYGNIGGNKHGESFR